MKAFPSRRARGFSLIEMMVVIAMVAMIVGIVAPGIFSTLVSNRLASAGQTLAGQLSLAQQLAVSGNQTVEVRFYQFEDPDSPGDNLSFRAVALMRVSKEDPATSGGGSGSGSGSGGGSTELMELLTDVYYLPSGIALGNTEAMSPLLAGNLLTPQQDDEKIIRRGKAARYKAFQMRPDGSTNLELLMGSYKPEDCYITLAEERLVIGNSEVPKNFYAIQIDPSTGKAMTYRP